jgi:hypothetical protein
MQEEFIIGGANRIMQEEFIIGGANRIMQGEFIIGGADRIQTLVVAVQELCRRNS